MCVLEEEREEVGDCLVDSCRDQDARRRGSGLWQQQCGRERLMDVAYMSEEEPESFLMHWLCAVRESEEQRATPKMSGLRSYKWDDCREAEHTGPSSFSWTLCLL